MMIRPEDPDDDKAKRISRKECAEFHERGVITSESEGVGNPDLEHHDRRYDREDSIGKGFEAPVARP